MTKRKEEKSQLFLNFNEKDSKPVIKDHNKNKLFSFNSI